MNAKPKCHILKNKQLYIGGGVEITEKSKKSKVSGKEELQTISQPSSLIFSGQTLTTVTDEPTVIMYAYDSPLVLGTHNLQSL